MQRNQLCMCGGSGYGGAYGGGNGRGRGDRRRGGRGRGRGDRRRGSDDDGFETVNPSNPDPVNSPQQQGGPRRDQRRRGINTHTNMLESHINFDNINYT